MILDLPDIRDTVCWKEIFQEGYREGRIESRRKSVEFANWLRNKGFSDTEIAEAIGCEISEVGKFLTEDSIGSPESDIADPLANEFHKPSRPVKS